MAEEQSQSSSSIDYKDSDKNAVNTHAPSPCLATCLVTCSVEQLVVWQLMGQSEWGDQIRQAEILR